MQVTSGAVDICSRSGPIITSGMRCSPGRSSSCRPAFGLPVAVPASSWRPVPSELFRCACIRCGWPACTTCTFWSSRRTALMNDVFCHFKLGAREPLLGGLLQIVQSQAFVLRASQSRGSACGLRWASQPPRNQRTSTRLTPGFSPSFIPRKVFRMASRFLYFLRLNPSASIGFLRSISFLINTRTSLVNDLV